MGYTIEQLEKIKESISEAEKFMNDGITWIQGSPNVIDKEPLIRKIKTQRRTIRKILPRVCEKPAIAFFGPSQCGKSHLVKNLLKGHNGNMTVLDKVNGIEIDYLKYLNPDGNGNEATALVTRFRHIDLMDHKDYPVKLELLSVKDVILSLLDGFITLGKIEELSCPAEESIKDLINKMKTLKTSKGTSCIIEDDVYEIKEYLEKYKRKELTFLLELLKKYNFWNLIADSVLKISVEELSEYFGILWYNHQSITILFNQLLSALKLCEFSIYCYANFDIINKQVHPNRNPQFPKLANILDVTTLSGFAQNSSETFKIYLNSSIDVNLPPHLICAICKEVTLYIPNFISVGTNDLPSNDIIKMMDILDFPGTRNGTPSSSIGAIANDQLIEIIKRGKINYLFNIYSDNFQINNLAIVSSLAKQLDGANKIPDLLDNWIKNYLGADSKERNEYFESSKSNIPPLFVILTFWNQILIYDKNKDNDNPKEKLDTAFMQRIKEDILSDHSWQRDWKTSEPKKFFNFFLLRDFNYCTLYNKVNSIETNVLPDRETYFKKLKEGFLKNSHSTSLFENPEYNFDQASNPDLDGSKLIIESFKKVSSNENKTKRFTLSCSKALDYVRQELNNEKRSDNMEERLDEIKSQIIDIRNRINRLASDNLSIGILVDHFSVKELDVYQQVYAIIKNKSLGDIKNLSQYYTFYLENPELKDLGSQQEKLAFLTDKFKKTSIEETRDYLQNDLDIDLDMLFSNDSNALEKTSLFIANRIKSFWIENYLNAEKFVTDKKYLNSGFINVLIHNLRTNYEKLRISHHIAEKISPFVDNTNVNDDVISMISNIITGILNNYVSSFGWDFTTVAEKERILSICEKNKIEVVKYLFDDKNLSTENELDISSIYHFLEHFDDKINTLDLNNSVDVKMNPFISSYLKWSGQFSLALVSNLENHDYDIDSNKKLIKLIDDYKHVNIN
jgi:hypothetical protein